MGWTTALMGTRALFGLAMFVSLAIVSGPADAQVLKKKKPAPRSVIVGLVTAPSEAESKRPVSLAISQRKKVSGAATISNFSGSGGQGVATTKTEVLAGKNVKPMMNAEAGAAMRLAEERYAAIVAGGGWPKIAKAGLRKGSNGNNVAALNQRLFIEGYLRQEATQAEFAQLFTTATEDALTRFQANNGLAPTGQLDGATVTALNVSANSRLQSIRANIPRLDIYNTNLSDRYLIVNIPGQQIEAVSGGQVYSRHNAIVGRPERPTPVVMTALSQVKFNPYWNAPASIIERDIIPKIESGGSRVLEDMDITVFRGVGGPEIDPDSVDWDDAVADDFHFRQEPGPKNAMATAKIEFDSPFGIYLHDTPEKQLFRSGRRFFSSGCVRVEKVDILLNWILNGQDGYNASRIAELAETLDRQDVPLTAPPQLRVVYLTAWPVGATVAFRNDVYDLDRTGFTVGQPLPLGETHEGLRYTLKPIPRTVAASDGDGGFSFFRRGKTAKGREKGKSFFDVEDEVEASTPSFIRGLNAPAKAQVAKTKSKSNVKEAKKAGKPKEETASFIVGLNGTKPVAKAKVKPVKTAAKQKDGKPVKVATKDTKPKTAKAATTCKPDASGKTPAKCDAKAKTKPKTPETATN